VNVIVVDAENAEPCFVCKLPVIDGDALVRTENWVAHMECVFAWQRRRAAGLDPQA